MQSTPLRISDDRDFDGITKAITDNSSNALFLMDENGVCTFLNPSAEKIFGFRLEELQDKPLHNYVHHTRPDGSAFPIHECPIGKSVFSLQNLKEHEDQFLNKSGQFIPVRCSAKTLTNNGKLTGILLEVRDVTEEKKAEILLRESEERYRDIALKLASIVDDQKKALDDTTEDLQKFAHVASHDMKEPVRKILFFLDRLQRSASGKLSLEELTFLSKSIKSAVRLESIIEGVLHYSTTEAADGGETKIDLEQLCREVISELEVVISEKRAVIRVDPLPEIYGSYFLFFQLLYNLINNSLKFSKTDTPPVVFISAEFSGSVFSLKVTDNGIGFNQDYAAKIFHPFTRLNPKDLYEGTGLGLSLCRKVVRRYNGSIRAQGTEGHGATIIISLPDSIVADKPAVV
jgi:PAS domain S-box-containing protein